jgi:hypothetical protein
LGLTQAFSEEHLKFLGLPIDGIGNEYASFDKLESLLHEKHNEATYKSPLVGSFVSSCSFQSNKGIITLIIIERDDEYQVKMSYTDRINYIPVYKKNHQKNLDDM